MNGDTPEDKTAERAALAARVTPVFTEVLAEHRQACGEDCGVSGNLRRFEERLGRVLSDRLGILASADHCASISFLPGENTWASLSVFLDDKVIEILIVEAPPPDRK